MDLLNMKDQIYKPQRLKKNNMKRLIILLGLVFICLVPFISAQQQPQEQTNKIFLNPFYRDSMSGNVNYTYTVNINPPDKISYVSSAIITFDMWINPTRTFTLWVNGKSCNNPSYTISTTYAGSGRAVIYYDCSNIINKAGTYNVTMRTSGNIGASTSWIDLTYSNKPKGRVDVHGTEYTAGIDKTAKNWVQLLNASNQEVNNGLCYISIFTPTHATYLSNALMTSSNDSGIYYYDYNVPVIPGVYPVIAECYYEASETEFYPTSIAINRGTAVFTNLDSAFEIDGNFFRYTENTPNPRRVDLNWTFSAANISACASVSELLLTSINIFVYGTLDSVPNDDVTISIFNWTSNTWIDLPNKIAEGAGYKSVSNVISTNNITKSGFYSATNGVKIRTTDTALTDTANNNFDVDKIFIGCDQLASPEWQDVKGSSEAHITSVIDNPFYAETLCGTNENNGDTGACATFENNLSVANYTWGYIYEKIQFINSYQTDTDSFYEYETGLGQDCTGIFAITRTDIDPVGNTTDFLNNVTLRASSNDNCIIKIPVVFNSSFREFDIEIYQENYMLWEVERNKDMVNYYRLPIESFCNDVETQHGITYDIPLHGGNDVSTLYSSNPVLLGCYRTVDDLY
jgi:hypothetical protein